jgi:hypothetical protein
LESKCFDSPGGLFSWHSRKIGRVSMGAGLVVRTISLL